MTSGVAGPSGPVEPFGSAASADRLAGRCAAIVLAGGQASRLGGADKPGLRIAGRSLAAAVAVAAYGAGAARIVYVGPPRPELLAELAGPGVAGAVEFTSEDPPGGGPIPALRAGLAKVGEPWVLLLAADLPFLTSGPLGELLAAATTPVPGGAAPGGAVLADDQGRPQWLSSCWRTADLRAALAGYEGASLRGLLGAMAHILVTATVEPGQPPYWLDCDTTAEVEAALRWTAGSI